MATSLQHPRDFLQKHMRMSHIYQPVMIKELLKGSGEASVRDVAAAFLARHESLPGSCHSRHLQLWLLPHPHLPCLQLILVNPLAATEFPIEACLPLSGPLCAMCAGSRFGFPQPPLARSAARPQLVIGQLHVRRITTGWISSTKMRAASRRPSIMTLQWRAHSAKLRRPPR